MTTISAGKFTAATLAATLATALLFGASSAAMAQQAGFPYTDNNCAYSIVYEA